MKKKTKSTSTMNQTMSGTSTPINPEWVTSGMQGLAAQTTKLAQSDPYSYVAGPDALQTQASQGASGLKVSPYYDEAAQGYKAAGNEGAQSIAGEIPSFLNPYLKDVVDTSLADYDYGAGQSRGQSMLDLAGDTTFGGSSGSIYRSGLEGEILRGRGALSSNLRSGAYDKASQLAVQQAALREQALNRQMQGAAGLASVGQAQGNDQRANVATQATIGDMLQQINQQRAQAPLTLQQFATENFAGLPLQLLQGQSTTGTMNGTQTGTTKTSGATLGDWLGFFANNAQSAAQMAGGG
jgi:hypothetical protein